MPFTVGLGVDARRTVAVAKLEALYEAGHEYVLITSVLGWLGGDVKPDPEQPVPAPPEPVKIDPADPLAALGLKDTRA